MIAMKVLDVLVVLVVMIVVIKHVYQTLCIENGVPRLCIREPAS
jgi:hypothetical protein